MEPEVYSTKATSFRSPEDLAEAGASETSAQLQVPNAVPNMLSRVSLHTERRRRPAPVERNPEHGKIKKTPTASRCFA